jgi:hypothetical protein
MRAEQARLEAYAAGRRLALFRTAGLARTARDRAAS